jgi:hypothetical protein
MVQEPTLLSLVPAAPQLARCELCGSEARVLENVALFQLSDGGVAQRATCEDCARALRRIEAAAGGLAQFTLGAPVASLVQPAPLEVELEPIRWEFVGQLPEIVEATSGTRYMVEVYGGPRTNGRWVGWLVFRPLWGTSTTPWLRTDWETTQADRADLAHWAGTLGATYIQGAFARARPRGGMPPLG